MGPCAVHGSLRPFRRVTLPNPAGDRDMKVLLAIALLLSIAVVPAIACPLEKSSATEGSQTHS
jgi:hypothetical protein